MNAGRKRDTSGIDVDALLYQTGRGLRRLADWCAHDPKRYFLVGLIVICFLALARDEEFWSFLILGGIGVFAFSWLQAGNQKMRDAETAFWNTYTAHAEELARARFQTVRRDRYGVVVLDGWRRELEYFLNKVMLPSLSRYDAKTIEKILAAHMPAFEVKIAEAADQLRGQQALSAMSPTDYEEYCAALLRKAGWTARTTKGSGDQGVDVVAERGGRRLVVQCKMYAGPVGNAAVQEIVAARIHERAHIAVVVANAGFTPAARQLAETTDVLLLHPSQLAGLSA